MLDAHTHFDAPLHDQLPVRRDLIDRRKRETGKGHSFGTYPRVVLSVPFSRQRVCEGRTRHRKFVAGGSSQGAVVEAYREEIEGGRG